VAFSAPDSRRAPLWSPPDRPAPLPAVPAGSHLHLRWTPYIDDRVRVVPEADRIFPQPALEVHPGDLAGLGLANGGRARINSGAATVTVTVRADRRTPPGQLYLPLDPLDESLKGFVRESQRPAGWPRSCVQITGIAPATD
jgi:anaerobic selenocysteine-containing dehydrogenase